jgi:uncharacterized protein
MVFFHLILTDDCNLCCRYCRGKAFLPGVSDAPEDIGIEIDTGLPADFAIEPEVLYRFLAADPDAALTFYGGEPLLKPDLITKIVNEAPVNRFMMQTNGTLLHRLGPDVIGKFETILVSIDGCEDLTDRNRGEGTYGRVMANLHRLIAEGYKGELIARMTVSEETDIFDSVTYLSDNPDFSFSSIHWQMDANFSNDFQGRNFRRWVETNYNPGISRLAREWVSRIEQTGIVPKWYPFLDPMEDLLNSLGSRLRCGAGYANYSIMTDGTIAPCPVMVGMKDYYLGTIAESDPKHLGSIEVAGRCRECDIGSFCGGRCLYSSIVKPWSEDEADFVCGTVRHLRGVLLDVLPRVKECIVDGTITSEAFSHTKYNGCEIIP